MRLLTYRTPTGEQLGIVTAHGVLSAPISAAEFYAAGQSALPRLTEYLAADHPASAYLTEADLTPAPLVPNPQKIICVGLNYGKHAQETKADVPTIPILFAKYANALAAHNEPIPYYPAFSSVDYEAELAVVIGKTAFQVSEAEALNYVLGYACANDFSERKLQRRASQWLMGKSPDKFFPIGPHLVTADEIPDPQALTIRGYLNGDLRQSSNTGDMLFSIAYLIADISQVMTLQPGDILSTGTPDGVIAGMEEKVWLKPGDEYVVEIERVGRLANRFV